MDEYVELTKKAVEEYIKNKKIIKIPRNLPKKFYIPRGGVFVTIKKGKELRGCVGTYLPAEKNLAQEIVSSAISACSRDGRFYPVSEKELSGLSYEVSVLSRPQKIKAIEKHNPKKHGLIVACADGRRGLLLPDLEGVDTVQDQIAIACQKGRIDPQSNNYELYEFTVEKHIYPHTHGLTPGALG